MVIDLNADLGEGCEYDEALLQIVSSANIACGFHAGDADTMQSAVCWAIKYGVAIGAHPSFLDRENFGRTAMFLPAETIYNQILYQLGALDAIVGSEGGVMRHVKPHGMLYNQAANDYAIAKCIAQAVKDYNPQLILFGLSGSLSILAAKEIGLSVQNEVFADRYYQANGSLVPRSMKNAVIESAEISLAQALEMAKHRRVQAVTGEWIDVEAETICLHGDNEHAINFAKNLRNALTAEGITIRANV